MNNNVGYSQIVTRHDTSEFACDSIRYWWITTGLKVFTTVLDKVYQTGRKVAPEFKSTMKIVFDTFLPQWNYTAKPQLQVI